MKDTKSKSGLNLNSASWTPQPKPDIIWEPVFLGVDLPPRIRREKFEDPENDKNSEFTPNFPLEESKSEEIPQGVNIPITNKFNVS